MSKRYHATIVPHTHWDRAWYVTFQEFRIRLVRLIDRLIDLLESDPEYTYFMLDGQTSLLEDYLEVRPERAEVLKALGRAGRISVGPWYVLPDEFLVSPEALIRNLMLGHRMGETYGGAMKIGYVPDGFGHIGQLPQIFQGFGIDTAFFWRGVGQEADDLGTEFEWVARDGSRVLTIWMPWGYHNLSNVGFPIRWGDTSQMVFDWELAIEQVKGSLDDLESMTNSSARLLMNGIDHAEAEPRVPELVRLANKAFADVDFRMGTLADHVAHVRSENGAFPTFSGEFRWGRFSEILQGVYSTRINLKQRNHQVETLLERYAEPLTAFAWMAGACPPEGTQDLLWTAWRWLLKNHPHDDIYGSGIDQIHDEMCYRFDQAEQIGDVLVRDSVRQLARQVDFSSQPGMPVLVFNPLNWTRDEVAVGEVDFDFDDPLADSFCVVDGSGVVVPHQVLDDEEYVWLETLKPNRKRRIRLAVPVRAVPCGYTTLYVQPADVLARHELTPIDLVIYPNGAENDFLRFTIESDGSLTVVDKATGTTYPALHRFYDVDDAGDEYSSCPCANSQTISTEGSRADVELFSEGPVLVQYSVRQSLEIPAALAEDRQHRSAERVHLRIDSILTLYRHQPGLHIQTQVHNPAKDHKLTVAFPTTLRPKKAHVDAAFQVSTRDVDLPESEGWLEDPTPLMHQRAFVDLSDGAVGLAVLNRGLPSVEVQQADKGTTIALTLLRSVGWLSRDDLSNRRISAGPIVPTPGAQCLGEHTFEYVILPHAGDWQAVYRHAHGYNAPLYLVRADTYEGMELREMPFIGVDLDWYNGVVTRIPWPRGGSLPDTMSFLQLDPELLVVTAVRQGEAGRGLVVRFFNPTDHPLTAHLHSWCPLEAAFRLNLNEDRLMDLQITRGAESMSTSNEAGSVVTVPVEGGEIVTCELMPRNTECQ